MEKEKEKEKEKEPEEQRSLTSPTTPDEPRSSLLDVVIKNYNVEKHLRTSRLLLTAEMLNESNAEQKIDDFHKEFLARHKLEEDCKITGFVFLLNKCGVVLVLEAPTATLFEMLRLLKEDSETNIYKNARILSLTEEVPREYPVWVTRSIADFPPLEFVKPKQWLKEIFDTLKGFLELGRELADMSEQKAKQHLATTSSRQFLQRIPSEDKIRGYAQSEDLCSIAEYLEIYDKPVDCTLEEELVWPVAPFLKY